MNSLKNIGMSPKYRQAHRETAKVVPNRIKMSCSNAERSSASAEVNLGNVHQLVNHLMRVSKYRNGLGFVKALGIGACIGVICAALTSVVIKITGGPWLFFEASRDESILMAGMAFAVFGKIGCFIAILFIVPALDKRSESIPRYDHQFFTDVFGLNENQ